ncbi:probable protein phosphatase 2C 13 [Camellia sinensis]|uniref:probable protein phosphatase 2C 13 n=1 Tax=Camellia sinensis TaxID=4442 RepID=UPI001036D7A4|nr:probable protein phosphatase 2C 13 [Camellia sinensis]XP_028091432.1 probable protein phosphatase 2C 13 [Camellia sinensis]
MVADTGVLLRQQSVSVLDLDVQNFLDVSSATPPLKPSSESVSVEISCFESVVSCKNGIQTTVIESSSASKFVPSIRSGSHTDIGYRKINEDEHICIDDLSAHLGYLFGCRLSSAFYAVFDGHGGSNAAAVFVKENAMKLFFEDANLPQTSEIDDLFLEQLESCHRKAFLLADQALAGECSSVPVYCGTTAITALILGRHLMVANAGDCRAVLCRKGVAVQMSHDHRPSYPPERKRVEELGGYIKYDCLNGDLAVTRALGDWYMKRPLGSASPLTAEPEVQQRMLTEDDEFLIVACDGIWDVMSNDEAVNLVRLALECHDDPKRCAKKLVNEALRRSKDDNLTAIVVCFTPPICQPQRPRLRCCSLSEEGMNRLRTFLEGN